MICGIFHRGSGIGNQLFRYVMTRTLALDKGLEWGMVAPELWKGNAWMRLDMGKPVPFSYHVEYPSGKVVPDIDWPLFQEDTSDYDWKGINSIKDNTIIDGEFQGELYWYHHLDEIREWLRPAFADHFRFPFEDLCIINFRGGEYVGVSELFLTKDYWDLAMNKMREINPDMKFAVVTDDVQTAKKFFPEIPEKNFSHDEFDWLQILKAKYLILSNSSFGILPALLNQNAEKIYAPKGWARRNIGQQMLKYNVYKKFEHI